jgi:YfiH family protein
VSSAWPERAIQGVTEAARRPSAPVMRSEAERTLLAYPDLGLPSLRHGIVVFKDVPPGADYPAWAGLAGGYLRSHLLPAAERVVIPCQVHSSRIIDADGPVETMPVGDGVVTGLPLTAIGISVSDCVPLLAVDIDRGVIGLAHCGWRGIAGGVVEEFVERLEVKGAEPAGTVFLIGAAIGPCCYEVGPDLLDCFRPEEVREHSRSAGRGVVFDLKGVVASRLIASGATRGRISVDNTCTSCQKYVLSSYRADGRDCGRMLAFLMLTGSS